MNVALDKRTSKTVNVKGSTGLLDISSFPQLTRNVSETQLLALKTAGTKALSNMSEQFSKLNKLGHTIAGKKSSEPCIVDKKKVIESKTAKPTFTVGNRDIDGNRKSRSNSGSSTSSHDFNERLQMDSGELEDTESLSRVSIASVGISKGGLSLIPPNDTDRCSSTGQIDRAGATTPEITIQGATDNGMFDDKERAVPPTTLNLPKNISHSSGEVDNRMPVNINDNNSLQTDDPKLHDKKRSNSEQDLALNITSSQSESALKSIKNNITNVASPVASTAKEILSPFSKFAKGVQSFGANLDPRKLKPGQVGIARNLSEHHLDQRQKLQERWSECRSHLIAL